MNISKEAKFYVFPKQLYFLCGILFIVIFIYLYPLIKCAYKYNVLIAPWGIIFLMSNVYFVFFLVLTFGILFSDLLENTNTKIPIMDREMYTPNKKSMNIVLLIKCRSIIYSTIIFIISFILILPFIDYTSEWGDIFYTGALTNILAEYNLQINISLKILETYHPVIAIIILYIILIEVTSVTGAFMVCIKCLFSNIISAILLSILSISNILVENLIIRYPNLYYFSIYSWLNIDKISVWYSEKQPSLLYIFIYLFSIEFLLYIIIYIKMIKRSLKSSRREKTNI